MTIVLTVPDAPEAGFTVAGAGFAVDSWIWITIEDLTDGTQPVEGPDAFRPALDGTFIRTDPSMLACGHTFQARAFVKDEIVAVSDEVTPLCEKLPPNARTADDDATPATMAVYADLVAAPLRADLRLVIGQALRGWDFAEPVAQPVTALTDAGLPAPQLLEVDLSDLGPLGAPAHTAAHDAEIYDLLLGHAAAGGLIGFSYHVGNPFTGGGVNDRDGVDLPQLAEPNNPRTQAGARWQAELDRIADVLQLFADVGAVVLFRPFHESNGSWFWWGQQDPAEFRAIWKAMFHYLTTSKGLHNVLWVYCANRDYGDALSDPIRLYPGDDLVDIVGLDIYDDDLRDAVPGRRGYAAIVALGKPFAITEYGPQNDPPHDGSVALPNERVIQLIKDRYPQTILATAWYSSQPPGGPNNHWQISDKPSPRALLLDVWAITL